MAVIPCWIKGRRSGDDVATRSSRLAGALRLQSFQAL